VAAGAAAGTARLPGERPVFDEPEDAEAEGADVEGWSEEPPCTAFVPGSPVEPEVVLDVPRAVLKF
jgi:hypothetical protein